MSSFEITLVNITILITGPTYKFVLPTNHFNTMVTCDPKHMTTYHLSQSLTSYPNGEVHEFKGQSNPNGHTTPEGESGPAANSLWGLERKLWWESQGYGVRKPEIADNAIELSVSSKSSYFLALMFANPNQSMI